MGLLAPIDIGLSTGLLFAWAVLALAIAFRLLNFPDLTIEGSLALGGAVFAILIKTGSPYLVAMTLAILAGMLSGALTAFLHVTFRMNKFLAGIIVVAIDYSLSLRIMGASNIGLLQRTSLFDIVKPVDALFGNSFQFGTHVLLIGLLLAVLSLFLVAISSRAGMRLRVAGSNPVYARSIGISVPGNIITGIALTNGLAAFAGVMLCGYQGFADAGMGGGVLILALASMAIGERIVPESRFTLPAFVVLAAVTGSVIYQIIVALAIALGLAPRT